MVPASGLLHSATLGRPGPGDLLDRRDHARHRDPPADHRGAERRSVRQPWGGRVAAPDTVAHARRHAQAVADAPPDLIPRGAPTFRGTAQTLCPGRGGRRWDNPAMVGRLIEMSVESVRVHMLSTQHVVILREMERDRYLPIWIGPWEASAIAMKLQGQSPERPLTHDLFATVLDLLGATVREVIIADR